MNRITRTIASTLALAVASGVLVLGAPAAGAQTTNDSYSSPTVLPSQPTGQVAGSNLGATLEIGEPALGGNGGSSVHYSIVAPASGPLRVSTAGSSYDTQLGIGTGDSAASLVLLAENDDANDSLQSEVAIDAVQGQTYRIVVDGYAAAQGDFSLSWNLAAAGSTNDSFASPTLLPPDMAGQITGNNIGATHEVDEHQVAAVGGASVHYAITAPVTGTLALSTAGSDYDTALGAGQGASAAELVIAAENDDVDDVRTSAINIPVVEGQTYRVIVDGYQGAQGNFNLAWAFTASPVANPETGVDAQFLSLVNQARSEARFCGAQHMPAVAPLVTDPVLIAASMAHSVDMATNNFFDHAGSNGSSPWDRAAAAGTTANSENIIAGSAEVADAVQGWLNSPGHCMNIMKADATRVGVALASNPASQFTNYWTMMTGA